MNKLYFIAVSAKQDIDQLKNFVDGRPEIHHWFVNLPNSIFVRTDLTAQQLWELLSPVVGTNFIFITEVSNYNYWGWLPKDHWSLIQNNG